MNDIEPAATGCRLANMQVNRAVLVTHNQREFARVADLTVVDWAR